MMDMVDLQNSTRDSTDSYGLQECRVICARTAELARDRVHLRDALKLFVFPLIRCCATTPATWLFRACARRASLSREA